MRALSPSAGRDGADALTLMHPATVPIQPEPLKTWVTHFRVLGWMVTAIGRSWRPGESGPDGRCTLCARCTAHGDGCLVVVGQYVAEDLAPGFSTRTLVDRTPGVARKGVVGGRERVGQRGDERPEGRRVRPLENH
jgi:hypothetical protein